MNDIRKIPMSEIQRKRKIKTKEKENTKKKENNKSNSRLPPESASF